MAHEGKPIGKIVGGEEEHTALQRHMEKQRRVEDHAEFAGCLKEHPEGFDAFIGHMNVAMAEFFALYGAQYTPLPPAKVLLVDVDKLPDNHHARARMRKGSSAFWHTTTQNLVVLCSRSWEYDRLPIAQLIAHELIHSASFTSLQVVQSDSLPQGDTAWPSLMSEYKEDGTLVGKVYLRRIGMEVLGKDISSEGGFKFLNEAVTEELTREFDRSFFKKIPALTGWVRGREIVQEDARKHGVSEEDIQDMLFFDMEDPQSPKLRESAYPRFRKDLQDIISDLYEACQGEEGAPESRDAVWRLFVNAALKGDMLPLARLVEKVYGKGAFRYLADMGETRRV